MITGRLHELYKQKKAANYALHHCFTQSKYRNIQLPNFLFKKMSIGTKQKNVGKESREEVCINKEVLLTSKMSQESTKSAEAWLIK